MEANSCEALNLHSGLMSVRSFSRQRRRNLARYRAESVMSVSELSLNSPRLLKAAGFWDGLGVDFGECSSSDEEGM